MAQPKFAPRRLEEEQWLDLSIPPVRESSADTESFEEWDDEEEDCDDYDTEDENAEKEEEEVEDDEEQEEEEEEEEVKEKEDKEDEDTAEQEILEIEEESERFQKLDTENLLQEEVNTVKKEIENDSREEIKRDEVLTSLYMVNNELLAVLANIDEIKIKHQFENQPRESQNVLKNQDDENFIIKEKMKKYIRKDFGEWTNNREEMHLRPGVPFRNLEYISKESQSKEYDNQLQDEFLSDMEEHQTIDFVPVPKRKQKRKPKRKEKKIVDEDEIFFDIEESAQPDEISSPYPEELIPVPKLGSEQWKQLMEQIMYKNPYEGYMPEEIEDPADAIWSRIDRLDYQEGRYVDEDMFDDTPLDEGPITREKIEEVIERIRQGLGPVPYNYEKG